MITAEQLTDINIARLTEYYEAARARIRAVTELAMLWLKSMTILSGGAVIGLITLVANVPEKQLNQEAIWWAFALFALSLFAVMSALFCGYLGQDEFYEAEFQTAENIYLKLTTDKAEERSQAWDRGIRWSSAGIALALVCLASFGGGCVAALLGFHIS